MMPEPNSGMEPSLFMWVFGGLIGALIAIGSYVVKLFQGRIQTLETEMKQCITREDLAAYIRATNEDNARKHTENLDSFREVRNDIKGAVHEINQDFDRVHERIDALVDRNASIDKRTQR